MTGDKRDRQLQQRLTLYSERRRKAERERPSLLAQVSSLGVLGLLLVLPMVAGAYLGRWLDSLATGYSFRWTLSLIFLGLVIGAFNVYWYLKE